MSPGMRPLVKPLEAVKAANIKLGLTRNPVMIFFAERLMDAVLKIYPYPESVVDRNGNTIHLLRGDRVSFWIATSGVWEATETDLVKAHVKKGDIVVDIGAHIGYYTLLLSRLVGDEGRVYAFEPVGENFELLKRNVAANGAKNVILVKKAVSSRTGISAMKGWQLQDEGKSQSADGDLEAAEVTTLDDYFSGTGTALDFIKIDIEGHEPAALEGARETILSSPKLKMMTEFYPFMLEENGVHPEQYIDFLRGLGFELFYFGGSDATLKPVQDAKELVAKHSGEESMVNLFCRRDQ